MSPAAPPSPPASLPPVSVRSASRGGWAASVLVAGGILAAIGLFVPWVRLDYPAIDGDPATTFFITPGPNFALYLRGLVTAPHRFTPEMTLLSLLFCGAPLLFVVLGASVFLRRGWMLAHGVRRATLIFAVVGTVMTALAAAFVLFLSDAFAVVQPTRLPMPGAATVLVGYLCAMLGAALLPVRSSESRREHGG